MRNYKRKTQYKPLMEDQLDEARRLIAAGSSYRQAAKQIGFNETTLRTRLKKGASGKLGRYRNTFSPDQEKELVSHCIALDQRFFGLTLKSLRFLLFKYAEDNNICHQFSVDSKLAGRDFTRGFMKRNRLSLRVPRKTSVARAMGFNRIQLSQYFDNLGAALRKYKLTPNQIYNMDETGVQTVPNKLPLHVAPTGKKEVAKTVAAEQGQTVTAVCAMNAVGNYIPPYFIFARKRENRQLLRGGPTGCDMAVTEKGYMNSPTFIKWLQHFAKYANPSEVNSVLLILDNHVSHTSLEAVTFAKAHHIHLLTLPPHSSHKTQPLDRCFFGPLKSYYDAAVDAWDVSNPGQTFDIYSVAATFKVAFEKAGTIATAVQGFKATGITPFDPNIFVEADFLPSEVTDQELLEQDSACAVDDNEQRILFPVDEISVPDQGSLSSSALVVTLPEEDNATTERGRNYDLVTHSKLGEHLTSPNDIIPLPKIKITRKRQGKGLKSMLLTSTPNKERLENESREKEKTAAEKERRVRERKERAEAKKRKLDFTVSLNQKKKKMNSKNRHNIDSHDDDSDNNVNYSVHDSSSDYNFSNDQPSDLEEEDDNGPGIEQEIQSPLLCPNNYAVVIVQGKTKKCFRHYVVKIISTHDDGGYDGIFYKKLPGTYKFTETKEEAFIGADDVVVKLSNPTRVHSARYQNAICFPEDLTEFTIFS